MFFFSFSGGYNIKTGPGCSIEQMKCDMGGSAAVFGAAKAVGQIKPPGVEVSLFLYGRCNANRRLLYRRHSITLRF